MLPLSPLRVPNLAISFTCLNIDLRHIVKTSLDPCMAISTGLPRGWNSFSLI